MNLFTYNDGKDILPPHKFRISPSQLSRFFDETAKWYREFLLGEEGFQGSTATELGNCVHAAAEYYTHHETIPHKEIHEYIESIDNPEVDKAVIYEQYPIMASTLVSGFLHSRQSTTTETELFVYTELLPEILVGGSIDRYDPKQAGGTISDYKTMGSLDKARLPTKFSRNYLFQQLTYAYILRKSGRPVENLELVYITRNNTNRVGTTGKPLKDYPSQVHIINHPVTDDDMEFIESILMLVAESVDLWYSSPELRHIVSQDMRNKTKSKKLLFT